MLQHKCCSTMCSAIIAVEKWVSALNQQKVEKKSDVTVA